MPPRPPYLSEFVPHLYSALRAGYSLEACGRDALAGLTVAVLALPLSMAIAIGTGTTPDRGLITSVVAGFFISLLGGSRYQIGGPAAAFIVINAAVITQHGLPGLMTATFLAGFILIIAALLRLGTFIKYVPGPVILGFTSAMSEPDGLGLGTLGFNPEVAESMVRAGGFTDFRVHDFPDKANLYYEVRI